MKPFKLLQFSTQKLRDVATHTRPDYTKTTREMPRTFSYIFLLTIKNLGSHTRSLENFFFMPFAITRRVREV